MSTIAGERLASSRETVPQRNTETLPQTKLSGTCRNLFGPVDHDELKRELTSKLREISRGDQLRWNFNFSEGQPLDGALKWEESPAEDCPEFYREKTVVSKKPFVDERIAHASKCGSRSMKVLKKTAMCNRRKLSRKTVARAQTKRLTDMRITGKQYAPLLLGYYCNINTSHNSHVKLLTVLILWILFSCRFLWKAKENGQRPQGEQKHGVKRILWVRAVLAGKGRK